MDLSLFLTIVGTIATIVFGFLSIDLFKRKKYPGKISFIEMKSISLFNNIAKNFEEIAILHNNQPIKENIIYVQGAFANTGDMDIDGSRIEKDISILLPEKFTWIKSKITRTSQDLKCTALIDDPKVLHFNLGLFRRNEYFEFEALIEAEDGATNYSDIVEIFKFDHRITNTQKIQKTELSSDSQIKKRRRNLKINAIMIGVFMVLFIVFFTLDIFYLRYSKINYLGDNGNGKRTEYSVVAKNDNTVELSEIDGNKEIIIPISAFQDKDKYVPIIPKETLWQKFKRNMWSTIVWIILYTLYVLYDVYELRKAKKLSKVIEKIK